VLVVRSRNVEWPTNVAAMAPGTTRGGGGYGVSGTCSGQGDFSRARCQGVASPTGPAGWPDGLKKRSPSQ
jgi:hypothetical protein